MTCKCDKIFHFNSGLLITIKNGELEAEYDDYRCGKFTEQIKFKYCPECGEQLDNRKEVPETMVYLKEVFKLFSKLKCSELTGIKGIDCPDCPLSGKNKRQFYCNKISDIMQEINKEYKLNK